MISVLTARAAGCGWRLAKRLLPLTLLVLAPAPPLFAGPGGDGHSHGDETAPMATSASPRVSMAGETYDVVAIYRNGSLTFYVDRLSDNAPVTGAMLELQRTSGNVIASRAAKAPMPSRRQRWRREARTS